MIQPEDEARPQFVYTFWTVDGTCLYVGCADDIVRRLHVHRRDQAWFDEVARIEIDRFPNRTSGYLAEAARIRKLDPRHNRRGKTKQEIPA